MPIIYFRGGCGQGWRDMMWSKGECMFRWRGRLNWKDIVERIIAGVIAGIAAGSTFFILDQLVGG